MVEFLVGIVGVLAIVAFLVMMATYNRRQFDSMDEARRQAGVLALRAEDVSNTPDFIRDWDAGDDHSTYSRDDRHHPASEGDFLDVYGDPIITGPNDATVMADVPHNPLNDLIQSSSPASRFGLLSRTDLKTISLEPFPAVSHLLYRADSLEIRSEVWMATTYGIY